MFSLKIIFWSFFSPTNYTTNWTPAHLLHHFMYEQVVYGCKNVLKVSEGHPTCYWSFCYLTYSRHVGVLKVKPFPQMQLTTTLLPGNCYSKSRVPKMWMAKVELINSHFNALLWTADGPAWIKLPLIFLYMILVWSCSTKTIGIHCLKPLHHYEDQAFFRTLL